jgi:glycosyltransferase involved in cell wall biosynthesis
MRTVLILAVNYPPKGGVGVIRTHKFVCYLPDFNWHPIVVTPGGSSKRIKDTTLLGDIPDDVDIHRPRFWNIWEKIPGDFSKILKQIFRPNHFPDTYLNWNRIAFKYIEREILPKNRIDAVYVSAGPHSTLLLAKMIWEKHRIPYFIDLRDPFSFSQYSVLRGAVDWRRKARSIENDVFSTAGCINNVTKQWHQRYKSLYPDLSCKFCFIPNGFDEADFEFPEAGSSNKVFTIGYNGSFSKLVPIAPLIEAMSYLFKESGIPIRLCIATPIKENTLKKNAALLYENGLIDYKGYLSHQQSLMNLSKADVCALLLSDSEATRGMVPAKTYEYLRVGKPILCLHRKDGHLSDIINSTSTGITIDINNKKEIRETLLSLHERWTSGNTMLRPNTAEIKKYERRELTKRLANKLDDMLRQ